MRAWKNVMSLGNSKTQRENKSERLPSSPQPSRPLCKAKSIRITRKRQTDILHHSSSIKSVPTTRTRSARWKTTCSTSDFVHELKSKALTVCFLKRMSQSTSMMLQERYQSIKELCGDLSSHSQEKMPFDSDTITQTHGEHYFEVRHQTLQRAWASLLKICVGMPPFTMKVITPTFTSSAIRLVKNRI